MHHHHPSSYRSIPTFALAGWLFADLLLGLTIIFLGSSIGTPKAILTPTPIATSTPSSDSTNVIHSAFATSTSPPPTLSSIQSPSPSPPPSLGSAQCYNITASSVIDSLSIIEQLNRQIPNTLNSQAGLVLIWAHGNGLNEGVQIAGQIGQILVSNFSQSFGRAVKKHLFFSVGDLYHVQLEIYFFVNTPWNSGTEAPCEYSQ